jgi:hypothetical protein
LIKSTQLIQVQKLLKLKIQSPQQCSCRKRAEPDLVLGCFFAIPAPSQLWPQKAICFTCKVGFGVFEATLTGTRSRISSEELAFALDSDAGWADPFDSP